MMATQPESGIVLISEGAYRLLLQLYPRRFRDEVGLDMSRTFRDCARETYSRSGLVGLAGYCLFTTFDVIKTALEERAHTGEWIMSKETLIKMGGPAMMIAGALLMITPNSEGYALGPSLLGLLIGLLALNVYAGRQGRRVVRGVILFTIAATIVTIVGYVAFIVMHLADDSYFLIYPGGAVFFCLLILGVVLSRKPVLPHRGEVFLLAILPVVAVTAYATYLEMTAGRALSMVWMSSNWNLFLLAFLVAGCGLVVLGAKMLETTEPVSKAVQQ